MLEHIQVSGELNKYWNAVDKQNDEARKAARRVERERKRVEMGSEYESSSDGEKNQNEKAEPEDSWSESSDQFDEYGEENAHEALGEIVQPDGDQTEQNKTIAIEAT